MKAQDTGVWFGRFCFINFEWVKEFGTELKGTLADLLKKLEETDTIQNWVNDATTCWWIILASFGITLVLSFIYMHLLRCFADLVTWIFIILLIILMALLGIFALNWSKKKQEKVDAADAASGEETSTSTKAYITLMKWIGWTFIGAAGLSACIVLCICHKIRLITAIIKVSSNFLHLLTFLDYCSLHQ